MEPNQKSFGQFKDLYTGQRAVVFGTGTTVNLFKKTEHFNGATFIGVNDIIWHKDLQMDFYFLGDAKEWHPIGYDKNRERYNKYKPTVRKFFCRKTIHHNKETKINIDQKFLPDWHQYVIDNPGLCRFVKEIDQKPVGDGSSTVFTAMQFALFAGFSEIYIVGCDIENHNSFIREEDFVNNPYKLHKNYENWTKFRDFMWERHRHIKLFVINPMSLEELFEEYKQE